MGGVMRDNYGDKIKVAPFVGSVYTEVALTVHEGGDYALASLSPKKARKLARRLIEAAEFVETADAQRAADGLV